MQPPTLTAGAGPDRVTLRPYAPDDAAALLEMATDPEMARWTTVPVPYAPEHAAAFVAAAAAGWERSQACTLAIEAVDPATDRSRYAGNVSLRLKEAAGAEIGFGLAPWARGRGIMAAAVRQMIAWGWRSRADGGPELTVVHWSAHVGNWGSRRVAWACGFAVEGTVRGLCVQRGDRYDAWTGSLVRGEPTQPRGEWLDAALLLGRHVALRPWRPDDATRVVEACRDAASQHWLPGLPTPYTVADAQWYVGSREEEHARGAGIYWCIADPVDDRCLGSIALMKLDGPLPEREIGYWAHPDARGRGVMTEAVRLVVRHAFVAVEDGGLGLPRVTLRAAGGNVASNLVAERAGLQRFGLARSAERLRDGAVDDLVLYDAHAPHG